MTTDVSDRIGQSLDRHGYAYVPAVLVPDPVSVLEEIGTLQPQYDGRILWSIQPERQYDDHYHSLNTKKLSPHTECYEFEGVPPRYLALWCVQPASCGGGQTTLFDSRAFLSARPVDEVQFLTNRAFRFCSSSGIQVSDLGRTALHPFIEQVEGRQIFRFSRNCVDLEGCVIAERFANDLITAFEAEHVEIEWEEGNLLIWDNHRILHSRTAFEDRDRKLTRAWLS